MLRAAMPQAVLLLALLSGSAAFGADNPVAQLYDGQVSTVEREIFALAQAMPAEKYDFAPPTSVGTFEGVRTFALQVRHIATNIYMASASILAEKCPVEVGTNENGSDSLKTKDQIVEYFRGALTYAHKAMATLNEKNILEQVPSPFGRGTQSRLASAAFLAYHSYDHYGQMVVYGRMNGVIPPSSQPRPRPAGKAAPKQ